MTENQIQQDLTYYVVHNLINGTFESGDLNGWQTYIYEYGAATAIIEASVTAASTGSYGCRLYGWTQVPAIGDSQAYGTLTQTISTAFTKLAFDYMVATPLGVPANTSVYMCMYLMCIDDATGSETNVPLMDVYDWCDWTHFEMTKDAIIAAILAYSDPDVYRLGQVTTITFEYYVYGNDADAPVAIEVALDNIITTSTQDNLISKSLGYQVQQSIGVQASLEYSVIPVWCNGGFELGDLTCWDSNASYGMYDTAEINVITDAKYTGVYGCQLLNEHNDDYTDYSQLWLRQEYLADNWDIVTFRYKVNNDTYIVPARFWVTLSFIDEYEYEDEVTILEVINPVAGSWIDISVDRSSIDLGTGHWSTTTKIRFRQLLGSPPA
jgi:hypothetical protein